MKFSNEQQVRIGVFGSAFQWFNEHEKISYLIGEEIAKLNCVLVTGATTGLPYHAGKGALKAGGFVLGISPALNPKEHTEKYNKPLDGCSVIIWTGSGYTGRNYLNVRNCDAAVFIGGETGTLEEFCIADYEGKVIGVLEGSGGVADKIKNIMKDCSTDHGTIIEYDKDPKSLINKIVSRLKERGAKHSNLTNQI